MKIIQSRVLPVLIPFGDVVVAVAQLNAALLQVDVRGNAAVRAVIFAANFAF